MRSEGGESWLAFGSVGRPHGVKGEVYLHAYNSSAEIPPHLKCPCDVRIKSGSTVTERTLLSFRGAGGTFCIRILGAESREHVADLVNCELLLLRECFSPLGPGEFYVEDVRGCDVYAQDGSKLGSVASVFWNGAQDVMQVTSISGEELLIPVVPRYVIGVDNSRKMVVVASDE